MIPPATAKPATVTAVLAVPPVMSILPALTAALPELEGNPLTPTDHYNGPVHVIAGEKSRYVTPSDHAAILRHFPAARIDTIAESGHNPHMERREDFVRAVRAEFQG